MNAKKAMKILGIITAVFVGLVVTYYLITWIISLISGLVALVVSGFQWFVGIAVFIFLFKAFFWGVIVVLIQLLGKRSHSLCPMLEME